MKITVTERLFDGYSHSTVMEFAPTVDGDISACTWIDAYPYQCQMLISDSVTGLDGLYYHFAPHA